MKTTNKNLLRLFIVIQIATLCMLFSSCSESSLDELDYQNKLEQALELRELCRAGDCSSEVLCSFKNGDYNYFIFYYQESYYFFSWIEGYPEDQYYFPNEPLTSIEALEVCSN